MRRCRSFLATTRIAPSSTFLRPIFQASATRMENCSIVSGSVVGTISTAIWLPLRVSKSLSFCDSAAMSLLDSVPVRSTTRPVSCGTATSAEAEKAKASRSANDSAATHSAVIARLDRAIQYSRDASGLRRSRGVLDSPLSRGMTAVGGTRIGAERAYFDGAGAGLKSTFGAVEISFSFSTEKFGFSL